MRKPKIAIVVSHPIQHFCPQYTSFAKSEYGEIKVFFASTLGYKEYHDPNFGKMISWSNIRLETFPHEFLNDGKIIQADKHIDAPGLEQRMEAFKPELVILYGYFQKLQRRAFRWAKHKRIPLAYIADSERMGRGNTLKEILKYPYLRIFFSQISWFLTVGNANEDYYHFYGVDPSKFIRMHFPIDIEHYEKAYENIGQLGKQVRQQNDIGEKETVLSVVGKLVPWKRQDDIIDAMILLENEGIYAHLFMLGSGEMMDSWKRKAQGLKKSRVHFTGFVNPEELPGYYAATDIYIHPAEKEPHSLAISEAIYMACPVILSDKCGSYGDTDDVQINKNGYVFKCGDINQLAALIKSVSLDQGIKERFSSCSHEIAIKYQQSAHAGVIKELAQKISDGSEN